MSDPARSLGYRIARAEQRYRDALREADALKDAGCRWSALRIYMRALQLVRAIDHARGTA